MNRQSAFNGNERMLKGELHCHTTRSDGAGDPEGVIRLYHQKGFDFLALTDHRIYNYKNFAPDLPITIIPGMEFDNAFEWITPRRLRTFHTVCLGPEKEAGNGFEQDEYFETGGAKNQYEYQEQYLDKFHERGNLTIYCHPQWSATPARYFENMKGNFAMEIWNSGVAFTRRVDMDAAYWDELLGQGKRIYGVATDDGHAMSHHGNGWVMVRAENNIRAILDALQNGAFYSSCGPEIYDFYVEDGKAVIECSPAAEIRFLSDMHRPGIVVSGDSTMTRAEWALRDEVIGDYGYKYIRATIIDRENHYAWTNPIFLD